MVDWDKVVNYLQENLPEGVYNAWFRDIELGEVNDDVVYIKFRDRFKLDWVESRYLNLLRDALKSVDGKNYIIRLVAPAEPEELKPPSFNYPEEPVQKEIFQSNLNERYTFENFVVGKSNQFAYSASLGVAKSPGNSYNPLFIYGSVGLGKTHLLHSIGNHIQNFYGNLRILYINTEHFLNEMIQAL
ncbi:MAG TPA: chromosomal replication initiator protein DnaA, partial [candidate division WOR-3 bacterium]|nr:chromosomal replication initiator protein DnaA [candidate division WOR-3 bacterium]